MNSLVTDTALLIYENGYDYHTAKQKTSVGSAEIDIPSNTEIHAALLHYVQTTAIEENDKLLTIHQDIALEAMQFLSDFEPHVTGHLLDGIACPHDSIILHLFASTHEEVMFFLSRKEIPYDMDEATLQMGRAFAQYPCIKFMVDNTPLELVIFPNERGYKTPPISSITQKGIKRFRLDKYRQQVK